MDRSGSHASMSFTRGWGAGEPRHLWGEKLRLPTPSETYTCTGARSFTDRWGSLASISFTRGGRENPGLLREGGGREGTTLALWRTKSYSCSVEPRATPGQLH